MYDDIPICPLILKIVYTLMIYPIIAKIRLSEICHRLFDSYNLGNCNILHKCQNTVKEAVEYLFIANYIKKFKILNDERIAKCNFVIF